MSSTGLSRVAAKTAAEVCQRFEPGEAARALLRPDLSPRQYLDLLTQKGELLDAVRFLAHALPKPEAVWWGVQCARAALGPTPAPKAAAALAAAERWLSDPTDENRRASLPAAEQAGVDTAAGCAAVGVFLSGGSLGPPALPPIPPAEDLTARVVAGGVFVAATASELDKAKEKLASCVAKGIEVASGTSRWPAKR
jgi:hypothetical protein